MIPTPTGRGASGRMLDHYLHTARAAWHLLLPPPAALHHPGCPAARGDTRATREYPAAWAWFTAEYPVLPAAIQQAADTGHDTHAWQLPTR